MKASTGNILDVQPTYHTSRGGNSNGLHVAQGSAPESDRHSAISELDGAQKRNGCVAQMDMPRNDAVTADESSASAAIPSLDVAPRGVAGVSGTVDGHGAERLKATTTSGELKQRSTGSWPSQEECIRMPLASVATISASPADSQTFTPLYLLASEIVDIVTKGYEQ